MGPEISEMLTEIEDLLLEYEVSVGTKPNYTLDGLRAAIKLFASVMMYKMWELQEKEGMSI